MTRNTFTFRFLFRQSSILFLALLLYSLPLCQTNSKKKSSLLLAPIEALIEEHQKKTTHIDGKQCPFYPSCSAYAKKALQEQGYKGFFISLDRLFYRESGTLYSKYFCTPTNIHPSAYLRYYDPLMPSPNPREKEEAGKPSFLRENFDCY